MAVPAHLGEEVFSGLRRLGKQAVYVEYEGEGHSPETYTPEHQLDICNRIFARFDEYLKYPQAETDEGRLDSLDADSFKYEITSKEIVSAKG